MKFEIIELDEFSGRKAGIYSIWIEDDAQTLFEKFLEENQQEFDTELGLLLIGSKL